MAWKAEIIIITKEGKSDGYVFFFWALLVWCKRYFLILAGTGGGWCIPLKVFRGYCQNALADLAEIWHSFAAILFTPTLKIAWSGHGVMTSCSVKICGFFDVSYSGWVLLLSGVGFCIADNIMAVRVIDKSYAVSPKVKVTPAMSRFRSLFRPLFLCLYNSPEPQGRWLEQNVCQIWNQRLRINHTTRHE